VLILKQFVEEQFRRRSFSLDRNPWCIATHRSLRSERERVPPQRVNLPRRVTWKLLI